jgi:hypothetical protein
MSCAVETLAKFSLESAQWVQIWKSHCWPFTKSSLVSMPAPSVLFGIAGTVSIAYLAWSQSESEDAILTVPAIPKSTDGAGIETSELWPGHYRV